VIAGLAYAHFRSPASATQLEASAVPPNVSIEYAEGAFARAITLQSHDETPFTVTRAVINKRYNQRGCDFTDQDASLPEDQFMLYRSPLPVTLQFGEQLTLMYAAFCNTPILLEIDTDKGYFTAPLAPK